MVSALRFAVALLLVGIVSVSCAAKPGEEAGRGVIFEKAVVAEKSLRHFQSFRIFSQKGYNGSLDRISGGFRVVVSETEGAISYGIQVIGDEKVELKANEKYIISFSYLSNTSFPLEFSVHQEEQLDPTYLIGNQGNVKIEESREWKHKRVIVATAAREFNSEDRPVFHFKVGFAPVGTDFSLKDLVIHGK